MKPRLSDDAARDVAELRNHYARKGRPEAVRNLRFAVQQAAERIDRDPQGGLAAPRPYPEAAEAGWRWIKEGRYWIAYSLTRPPLIVAVIYDQADLPRRI